MNDTPLRVVLAGTPEFAIPSFEAVAVSHHQVHGVWTQPDRPAGRGQKLLPSPVKNWANTHQFSVFQPTTFRDEQAQKQLADLSPDIMIVIAYGLILPQAVLEIPRLGCINVHASILPRWRGASPIQQAILAGDSQTGVTIMQMDAGMDTGPSLCQVFCDIEPTETSASLHDKLSQLAVPPLLSSLEGVAQGTLTPNPQPAEGVSYAPKIRKADAQLNWHSSAWQVDCCVRAYYPWPVAFTLINTDLRLRIVSGKALSIQTSEPPGTILKLDSEGMLIACDGSTFLVGHIQFPGGKVLAVADWLKGGKTDLQVGQILKSGNC